MPKYDFMLQKWDIQLNQEIEYMWKDRDFYLSPKTWVKVWSKYGQKLLDSTKKSTIDAIKTSSDKAIQKTAEATGDLIGINIADKIASVSKKKSIKELHNNDDDVEITAHKKRYLFPEERRQIIEELKLVPKKDGYLWKLLMN